MSDYPMLISNKLHSFRNFATTKIISLKLICNFPVVRDGILHMHFEMPDMRYYSFFCKKSYKPYFYWRKNS